MSLKMVLGLVACGLVVSSVGCTSGIDTVRGQNPAAAIGPQSGQVQQVGFQIDDETLARRSAADGYRPTPFPLMRSSDQSRTQTAAPVQPAAPQPAAAPLRPVASVMPGSHQQVQYVSSHQETCPHCREGGLNSRGKCGLCGWLGRHGKGWYPTHRHTYDYKAPKNLVYPQTNQPGAVVRYPYYTVKGPDCFFYKE